MCTNKTDLRVFIGRRRRRDDKINIVDTKKVTTTIYFLLRCLLLLLISGDHVKYFGELSKTDPYCGTCPYMAISSSVLLF